MEAIEKFQQGEFDISKLFEPAELSSRVVLTTESCLECNIPPMLNFLPTAHLSILSLPNQIIVLILCLSPPLSLLDTEANGFQDLRLRDWVLLPSDIPWEVKPGDRLLRWRKCKMHALNAGAQDANIATLSSIEVQRMGDTTLPMSVSSDMREWYFTSSYM